MNNYLLLVLLPHLDCFLTIIGAITVIIGLIGSFISISAISEADGEGEEKSAKSMLVTFVKALIAGLIMLFISIFIPTKAEIIQLKVLGALSELRGADKIPQKLIDRINDLLDLKEESKE